MSLRYLAGAAAAIWGIVGFPDAMTPGPVSAPPAAWRFRIGALDLTAVRDGRYVTPNDGGDFGSKAGPAAVARLLAEAGQATDRITLDVDALVVRTPGRLVLIDTGLGPADHGVLLRSLDMAGVSPGEITDVLITHAHTDHVGGLLAAAGRSAFPGAVIRLSAREWEVMQRQAETRKLAAVVAPQVKTFEPGRPILPGITSIALYGHTPGHVGYEITSRGRRLEDIGDTAHSSIVSLARPDWSGGIDVDPAAGAATRRETLEHLALTHELVFAPHFPFPGVGRIVAKGEGFAWKPVGRGVPAVTPKPAAGGPSTESPSPVGRPGGTGSLRRRSGR
ncbi:MAG: fold metallo-hydrolase [Caulobacteraceae bacterium]|nr:fold metallo-hydrolase [Caulobacteraceae bacterium]